MYSYGFSTLPTVGDGFLYHFTPATSLMLILQEMKLKVSDFSHLNDLNETDICCESNDGGWNEVKIKQYIIDHCGLISFTQNYYEGEPRPSNVQTGCNHPRMWAQYAANNTGACVVINEQKFIKDNEAILKNRFYLFENVEYNRDLYDTNIQTSSDPEEFIKKNYQHIFFKKHIDWEREHERRFFGIDLPPYLSILNSVEFICLGQKFIDNKEYMRNLIETLISPTSVCFDKITPNDFCLQTNQIGRCPLISWAFEIKKAVKTLKLYTEKYISHME